MELSRRAFLRGRARWQCEIRPPWSLVESCFIDKCSQCDQCIETCPENIITRGSGGFPKIDFSNGSGECTFCGDCAHVCDDYAIVYNANKPAWLVKANISSLCLAQRGVVCRSCGEMCEKEAIEFQTFSQGIALPKIDTDTCNGCGACVASCPVQAIGVDYDYLDVESA